MTVVAKCSFYYHHYSPPHSTFWLLNYSKCLPIQDIMDFTKNITWSGRQISCQRENKTRLLRIHKDLYSNIIIYIFTKYEKKLLGNDTQQEAEHSKV